MGLQTYRAAASRWLWRAATTTFLEPSRLRDAGDQRPCRESGTLGGAERERGGAGWWVEHGWLWQPLQWTPRPLPGPVGRRKPEASLPRGGGSVSKGNHTSTLDKQQVARLPRANRINLNAHRRSWAKSKHRTQAKLHHLPAETSESRNTSPGRLALCRGEDGRRRPRAMPVCGMEAKGTLEEGQGPGHSGSCGGGQSSG